MDGASQSLPGVIKCTVPRTVVNIEGCREIEGADVWREIMPEKSLVCSVLTEQTLSYAETFSATSPLYELRTEIKEPTTLQQNSSGNLWDAQTSYERPEHNQWALKTRLVVDRSWGAGPGVQVLRHVLHR